MTRLELGILSVDLDALDELAGWLGSAAVAHDAAGGKVGGALTVDWTGEAADAGRLAQTRWERSRATTADRLRGLETAARRAAYAYALASEHAVRLWAQVDL